MSPRDKPLVWLAREIRTPPLGHAARIEAGVLLRRLQRGEVLTMPHSRPMPTIGPRCHELRFRDRDRHWRIVYRVDEDAVIIADVFAKSSRRTPLSVLRATRRRLREYDSA